MGVVNSEGETPLDIAEEEAMEELLKNEINRQGAFINELIHSFFALWSRASAKRRGSQGRGFTH